MKNFFKLLSFILGVFLLGILLIIVYWYIRPNRAQVDTNVVVESWDIANNGQHNSNTDMITWNGEMYIAYVSSPYHFSSEDSTLHIKHSSDLGRTWMEDSTFNPDQNDIRDPKFAVMGIVSSSMHSITTHSILNPTRLCTPTLKTAKIGHHLRLSLAWMAGCSGVPKHRMG